MSCLSQGSQLMISSLSALGIGAASFASEEKRSEQRYSGKPDAKRNAQKKELQKFRNSKPQNFFSNGVMK